MSTSLRILFIESSEIDTQLVLKQLHKKGYILTHQRVDSAVMMQLALQRHSWDLIICNDWLPNFNAPEALQVLKTSGLELPFIVVSSTIKEDLAVEMIQAGASDYLLKADLNRLAFSIMRELRQAEVRLTKQRVETSLSQLAAIVESSEDAIISTDLQGRVLTWNIGAERLYGYSALEAKGKSLIDLIQPSNHLLLSVPTEQHANGVIDCRQVTQQRKAGELIEVLLTVSLIRGNGGDVAGFAIIARDFSEQQMIQRMKDEFISIINHELRTPLASLQGSIDLLLTGHLGELSQQGCRMLEIAANNVDRLVQLTNNILDLEGLNSGKITILKQPCNIGELVDQAQAKVQAHALKRGIQVLATPRPIQVLLDPKWIEQVLNHLLINAIQFSHPEGRIWLNVELKQEEQLAGLQKPYVLVSIKDEGQGIPADKLEAIFGQFQQADASDTRRQGGAGLGLAVCRSVVQQHQGRLWVESTIGQGSTFFLALPVQRVASVEGYCAKGYCSSLSRET